jgi:hypothetical protein
LKDFCRTLNIRFCSKQLSIRYKARWDVTSTHFNSFFFFPYLLQCYSRIPTVARGYFQALVELYKMQTVHHPLPVIFTLILLKVCHQIKQLICRMNHSWTPFLAVWWSISFCPKKCNSTSSTDCSTDSRREPYLLTALCHIDTGCYLQTMSGIQISVKRKVILINERIFVEYSMSFHKD